MRWVGCGRATTTKRRVAGWRLRRARADRSRDLDGRRTVGRCFG
jgi:hypothetical protein